MFSLVIAGRSRVGHAFDVEALREHIAIYLLATLAVQGYRTARAVRRPGRRAVTRRTLSISPPHTGRH
jgi:hypothetical protein